MATRANAKKLTRDADDSDEEEEVGEINTKPLLGDDGEPLTAAGVFHDTIRELGTFYIANI